MLSPAGVLHATAGFLQGLDILQGQFPGGPDICKGYFLEAQIFCKGYSLEACIFCKGYILEAMRVPVQFMMRKEKLTDTEVALQNMGTR